MVLVDSCVWINALSRKGSLEVKLAVQGLLDEYEAMWCSPVRLEVLGGCRKQERKRISQYFSVIPYRACREEDFEYGVSLAWRIRDQGITIPWFDLLIATIAIRDELRLYTVDKHFYAIQRFCPLYLYTPGYGGKFEPH